MATLRVRTFLWARFGGDAVEIAGLDLPRASQDALTLKALANALLALVPSPTLSKDIVAKKVDQAMDKTLPPSSDIQPGISIRNGPIQEIEMADANGVETNGDTTKRKSRGTMHRPSYAEAESSEEDDKPLVGHRVIATHSIVRFLAYTASADFS